MKSTIHLCGISHIQDSYQNTFPANFALNFNLKRVCFASKHESAQHSCLCRSGNKCRAFPEPWLAHICFLLSEISCSISKVGVACKTQASLISEQHNYFYNKIVNRIPNVKQLQLTDLIFYLMNCNDNIINMQYIKFVSSCFDLRNKFLSGL